MSASKHQGLAAPALTSCAASDDQTGAHWRTPPALVERCAALVGIAGWDLDAAAEVAGLRVPQRIARIAFRPDGDRLAMVGRNGLAIVWDFGKVRIEGTSTPSAAPRSQ